MLWLVPHLFPAPHLLQAAQGARLPALEALLGRGSRQPCAAEGIEAALCEALGVARQQDWPLAPATLVADGGVAGDAYWLRADPVHLRVMRDRIVLADSQSLELSGQEADALCASIGDHFGAELSPLSLHPQRWYLRFHSAPRLVTTPLSVAVGRDIEPLLPQGRDAMRIRALSNELQMLLHAHPVNQAREARGELTVNSLWLWGGGHLPACPRFAVPIYARNTEAQALAALCAARAHALPDSLDAQLLETNGVLVLDALTRSGQAGDAYGWREALGELEHNWFVPLREMLRRIDPQGLRLVDPVSGTALHLHAGDAWRVWRRPQRLAAITG